MSTPDPWRHRKSIICLVAQATPATGMDNVGKPTCLPDAYHLTVNIITHLHASDAWGEEKVFEVGNLKDWTKPLSYIHELADHDSKFGGAYLVSVHNKAVIQRAAWWWSRAYNMNWSVLDVFSNNARLEDISDVYNGPAIVTAEERYAFSVKTACKNVGIEYQENNEFKSLCNLWTQLMK